MAKEPDDSEAIDFPLVGTRAQSIQRLQIGLSGLAAMALLVGLATIIMDRARQTDAAAVPEAAATTQARAASTANDALADAGVAPEVAAPAKAAPGAKPADDGIAPASGQ